MTSVNSMSTNSDIFYRYIKPTLKRKSNIIVCYVSRGVERILPPKAKFVIQAEGEGYTWTRWQ